MEKINRERLRRLQIQYSGNRVPFDREDVGFLLDCIDWLKIENEKSGTRAPFERRVIDD